jgi:hypothetical protein
MQAALVIRSITIDLTTIAGTIMDRFLGPMVTPPIIGRTRRACIAHNAAQPQAKARRVIRRRACFVAPRCRHKAKVKLGPTRSFGRDALRRVLARNEYIVIHRGTVGRGSARAAGRDNEFQTNRSQRVIFFVH